MIERYEFGALYGHSNLGEFARPWVRGYPVRGYIPANSGTL